MPRRRALRVFGGTLAALLLPPLRPGFAEGGTQMCHPGVQGWCGPSTCNADRVCCTSCCRENDCPHQHSCCDPCDPDRARCSNGECVPGDVAPDCCRRRGLQPCGGKCCGEGEQCCGTACCGPGLTCADAQAGICCFRTRGADYYCGKGDRRCEEKLKKDFNRKRRECRARAGAGANRAPEASLGFGYMNCIAPATLSYQRDVSLKCPPVPDHEFCGSGRDGRGGGLCAAATLSCCYGPSVAGSASRARAATAPDPVLDAPDEPLDAPPPIARSSSGGGRVTPAQLRARVRAAAPRLDRAFRRFDAAQAAYRQDGRSARAVAEACDAYRREVLRVRASVAAGSGGLPQRRLLATYDASAAALLAQRKSVLAASRAAGPAAQRDATRAWARASRNAALARRALGCGRTC